MEFSLFESPIRESDEATLPPAFLACGRKLSPFSRFFSGSGEAVPRQFFLFGVTAKALSRQSFFFSEPVRYTKRTEPPVPSAMPEKFV